VHSTDTDQGVTVALGPYEVTVATTYGPRVTGLRRDDGPDLFAHLDETVVIDPPGLPAYHFHGGHRLWAAPEEPRVTYAPDDHDCDVALERGRLLIVGPDDTAGLAKHLTLRAEGDGLIVDHRIVNNGSGPIVVAPWAITQFRLGGVALVPTGARRDGPQADRSLVLWPYTDLADYRLTVGSGHIAISAAPGPKVKLGIGPNPERLGYHLEGQLFVKQVPAQTEGRYPDRGAVGQVFSNEEFCELESVGAISTIEPGTGVTHRETWSLSPCPDFERAIERVVGVI
jgi:hypothetical protein